MTCERLGMTPSRVWKSGERRATPKGRPLEGFYNESYCSIALPALGTESLVDAMRVHVAELSKHRELLDEFVTSGGEVGLAVGWFLERDSGECLAWEFLRDCADLKISLLFYIYLSPPQEVFDDSRNGVRA